jgi:hypothetical protein
MQKDKKNKELKKNFNKLKLKQALRSNLIRRKRKPLIKNPQGEFDVS